MSIDKIGSQPPDMGDDGSLDKLAEPLAGKLQEPLAVKGEAMIKEIAEAASAAAPPKLDQVEGALLGDHKLQGMLVRDKLQLGDEKVQMQMAERQPKGVGDLQIKNKLVLGNEKVSMIGHKLPGDLQIKHKLEHADERMSVIGGAPEEKSVWAAKLKGLGNDAVRIDDEEEGGDPLLAKGRIADLGRSAARIGDEEEGGDPLLIKGQIASAGKAGIEPIKESGYKESDRLDLAGKSWAGVGASLGDVQEGKWEQELPDAATSGVRFHKNETPAFKLTSKLDQAGDKWLQSDSDIKEARDVKLAQSPNIWGERNAGLGGAAGEGRVKLDEGGLDADHKLPGIEHK